MTIYRPYRCKCPVFQANDQVTFFSIVPHGNDIFYKFGFVTVFLKDELSLCIYSLRFLPMCLKFFYNF